MFFNPHPGFAHGTAADAWNDAWCLQLRDAIQLVPDGYARLWCERVGDRPTQLVAVPYVCTAVPPVCSAASAALECSLSDALRCLTTSLTPSITSGHSIGSAATRQAQHSPEG